MTSDRHNAAAAVFTIIYASVAGVAWFAAISAIDGGDAGLAPFGVPHYLYLAGFSALAAFGGWAIGGAARSRDGGALPALSMAFTAAAVYFITVKLFSVAGKEYQFGQIHALTPVYCLVIAAALSTRGWGYIRLFLFTYAVSCAHYLAVLAAISVYDDTAGNIISAPLMNDFFVLNTDFLVPGLVGGSLGAFLSFASLAIFDQRFRAPHFILLSTALMAAIGALGLMVESETPPGAWFWLYVPWQTVFGVLILTRAVQRT